MKRTIICIIAFMVSCNLFGMNWIKKANVPKWSTQFRHKVKADFVEEMVDNWLLATYPRICLFDLLAKLKKPKRVKLPQIIHTQSDLFEELVDNWLGQSIGPIDPPLDQSSRQ